MESPEWGGLGREMYGVPTRGGGPAGADDGLPPAPPPPRRRVGDIHYLWGRQLFRVLCVQPLRHQHVSQDGAKVVSHNGLLLQPTVVLEG